MRFEMQNDTRARTGGRQLQKILAGMGMKRTLSESRDIVSTMLGYGGWQDLRSNLGDVMSEDDDMVAPEEIVRRRRQQASALMAAGLTPVQAEEAAERLAITRRLDRAPERPAQVDDDHERYHPVRFARDADEIYHDEMEAREAGRGHSLRSFVAMGEPAEFESDDQAEEFMLGEYAAIVSDWAATVAIPPMDEIGLDTGGDIDLLLAGRNILSGKGRILDVSPMAGYLAAKPFEPHAGIELRRGTRYVHFGKDAFASPFPGRGIEGAYVSPESRDTATVVLVASPEPFVDELTNEERMLQGMRAIALMVDVSSAQIAVMDRSADAAPFWEPSITQAVHAAMNAVLAEAEGGPFVKRVFPEGTDESMRMRLERARTPDKEARVLEEIEEATGAPVVWRMDIGKSIPLRPIEQPKASTVVQVDQHVAAMARWASTCREEETSYSIAEQGLRLANEAWRERIGRVRRVGMERTMLDLGNVLFIAAAEIGVERARRVPEALDDYQIAPLRPAWAAYLAMVSNEDVHEALEELEEAVNRRALVGLPATPIDLWTLAIGAYLHGDEETAAGTYADAYMAFPEFNLALDMGLYMPGRYHVDYKGDWNILERYAELLSNLFVDNDHRLRFIDMKQEVVPKSRRDLVIEMRNEDAAGLGI